MAKNQITGRVIAVSERVEIPSRDATRQLMAKRQLFIDCTRYDPYTGERGYENTPLLDFTGKSLEKLEGMVASGLKKDDVVTVTFDVQGNKWTNKEGKMQVITSIRPYDIEQVHLRQAQNATEPVQAPTQAPQQQGNDDNLPF